VDEKTVMVIWQLDGSTLYLCNPCLDELGPIPGSWKEEPLGTCSVCGEVDQLSREEMDEYHHHMDNLQWEDEPYNREGDPWWSPDEPNPQELK
jgi:hypothetical protein